MCPCSQSWLDVLRRKTLKAKSALGHAAHAASSALGDIVGFAKPSHAAPLRLLTGQSHYAPNAVVAVKVGTLWLLHALVIEPLPSLVCYVQGDTAQSVAHRCYGSSKMWRAILQKNSEIDKDAIRPGTCLKI